MVIGPVSGSLRHIPVGWEDEKGELDEEEEEKEEGEDKKEEEEASCGREYIRNVTNLALCSS